MARCRQVLGEHCVALDLFVQLSLQCRLVALRIAQRLRTAACMRPYRFTST